MAIPTITEFENQIETDRKEYFSCLQATLALLNSIPTSDNIQNKMTELHNKGVTFFNLFERSIDEYGLPYFELNIDTKNRKVEDAICLVDVIINHWTTLRQLSEKFSVSCPTPSTTAYSSIQRLIKYFEKEKSKELKNKFMAAKLPTQGFDDKAKFSGWQIGSLNLTITQIVVGLVFILITGLIIFNKDVLNGMQYFFSRAVLSLGLTLIGSALLEGTVKLDWTIQKSITIKAVGWVALFIMLYYFNPPSAPTI
jgi:uncharacterized integral membrane protein